MFLLATLSLIFRLDANCEGSIDSFVILNFTAPTPIKSNTSLQKHPGSIDLDSTAEMTKFRGLGCLISLENVTMDCSCWSKSNDQGSHLSTSGVNSKTPSFPTISSLWALLMGLYNMRSSSCSGMHRPICGKNIEWFCMLGSLDKNFGHLVNLYSNQSHHNWVDEAFLHIRDV